MEIRMDGVSTGQDDGAERCWMGSATVQGRGGQLRYKVARTPERMRSTYSAEKNIMVKWIFTVREDI